MVDNSEDQKSTKTRQKAEAMESIVTGMRLLFRAQFPGRRVHFTLVYTESNQECEDIACGFATDLNAEGSEALMGYALKELRDGNALHRYEFDGNGCIKEIHEPPPTH